MQESSSGLKRAPPDELENVGADDEFEWATGKLTLRE